MKSEILQEIINRQNLSFEESESLSKLIIEGDLTDLELTAYLIALQSKGISSDELAGFGGI